MENVDLDDSHFCIKCKATIMGLENYITHRKSLCGTLKSSPKYGRAKKSSALTSSPLPSSSTIGLGSPAYDPLVFSETSVSSPMRNSFEKKSADLDKSRKSLNESYELDADLGADVLFSYLQIQSIQSLEPLATHGGAGNQSQKSVDTPEHEDWIGGLHSREVSQIHGMGKNLFKPIEFVDDFSESSGNEDDESTVSEHGESIHQISSPTVPANHTGGKWKPESRSRYALRVSPYSPPSLNWVYNLHEDETSNTHEIEQHPPSHYTRGKWIPGSKMTIDFKEMELKKNSVNDFWCNICSRKLKTKHSYELHLKSQIHVKHTQQEQDLEKADLQRLPLPDILPSQIIKSMEEQTEKERVKNRKRFRICTFKRCNLCKHVVRRHLIGKHLISHFHYRRMKAQPEKSVENLKVILENMHWIVLQSPFQCRPCRFYANTEECFLQHWKSKEHLMACTGPNKFWCNYCQFQCDSNDEMYAHMIGRAHKEVLLVINRSVPVCISKKVNITCPKCRQAFRYNFHLRRHIENVHAQQLTLGTASDAYQCRYQCKICSEWLRSKIALQRHEKFKHKLLKYFCAVCDLEFETPEKAKNHRKTNAHKKARFKNSTNNDKYKPLTVRKKKKISSEPINCKNCDNVFPDEELLLKHCKEKHPHLVHSCPVCGESFAVAQALGRHTRICQPQDNLSAGNSANKWRCKDCSYSCAYESELIFHGLFHVYGIVTRDQKLKCPLCEKSFSKESLRSHLRQHTKEKIFSCDFCDVKFSRRHNLKDHIKNVHNPGSVEKTTKSQTKQLNEDLKSLDKANSACHTYEISLTNELSAKKHMESVNMSASTIEQNSTASPQELFACNKCNFQGGSMIILKRHMQKIHRIVEKTIYKCNKCTFESIKRSHIDRHALTHTKEKPHKCPHCDFRTANWDNLRKHILNNKTRHPGRCIYECKFCQLGNNNLKEKTDIFKTNILKEYQKHLLQVHKVTSTSQSVLS